MALAHVREVQSFEKNTSPLPPIAEHFWRGLVYQNNPCLFALSTFSNQKELLQSTQKGGVKSQLQNDLDQADLETDISKY